MAAELLSSPAEHSPLHKPKARWTAAEDEALVRAVEERGPQNWNAIALAVAGRTGKQCRERWITKLSPAYRADAWTSEEDGALARLQAEHGNQWARFRAQFPHRSTVSIKNRWVSLRRRQQREPEPQQAVAVVDDRQAQSLAFDDGALPSFLSFESQFAFDDFSWGL
jgi:hypothetical protein